jgi:hypothetical protein
MEIDSKPEVMDKLERRLIQLKIEREAVKKEKDEASQKRLGLIEDEIKRLGAEYADLEEIWKAEKGAVLGAAHLKEEIEKVRADIAKLQRDGKLEQVAELQYGKLPELEAKLKSAAAAEAGEAGPRRGRGRGRNSDSAENSGDAEQNNASEGSVDADNAEGDRPSRNRNRNRNRRDRNDRTEGDNRNNGPESEGEERFDRNDRNNRNNRQRDRRRGGRMGDEVEPEILEDDVLIPIAGILDVLDNYAFVRTSGYLPGNNDVYVSLGQVKKYNLRKGDAVIGSIKQPRDGEGLISYFKSFHLFI